ncbi:hypothetical protein EDD18DRAFT_1351929 [Armillaria luteobubalina]|uniref:Uncharacterized protein n=1 Tax=Armillaria luteobubalina TaxID=153913 RepID=A0AA39Q6D4_9AGAR|nr:hypothetical protein EDD18DRAFT_1351929 [Armillaria luteobubalina]
MEKAQGRTDNLPTIPPEPVPPAPLVNETKFGDPYRFRREISDAIRPLLLNGGRAPSDILPVIKKVHPLLLAHMKDLMDHRKRDHRLGILLCQTCYALACQTPPRHHKMSEWSVWVPKPEEYDALGPENAIGDTEMFDAMIRYLTREEIYAKYKATWHELDRAYNESVKKRNELITAHEAAKRAREAAVLKAKQDMDAEKKKAPASSQMKISLSKGASETKVQTSARIIKNRPFRVQTQESMGQTKSPTTLKRPLTETESVSKFPRLEGENSRLIRLATLDSDESTFPIPFSFDPVVLSRALDLGPSRRALCHACFAAGFGTACDRDDYLSGACTRCRKAHRRCESLMRRPSDQGQLGDILFQAARGSNNAISHQISQIQHCQSLVFSLSQIVASETRNMEILVSSLIGSLRSIRRDGTQGDFVPILEDLVQAHPILQRLIGEGLLKLKDPDVSPAFNRHGPTGDNTSSSSSGLTSSKASTSDTTERAHSGNQESKDDSMVVEND